MPKLVFELMIQARALIGRCISDLDLIGRVCPLVSIILKTSLNGIWVQFLMEVHIFSNKDMNRDYNLDL